MRISWDILAYRWLNARLCYSTANALELPQSCAKPSVYGDFYSIRPVSCCCLLFVRSPSIITSIVAIYTITRKSKEPKLIPLVPVVLLSKPLYFFSTVCWRTVFKQIGVSTGYLPTNLPIFTRRVSNKTGQSTLFVQGLEMSSDTRIHVEIRQNIAFASGRNTLTSIMLKLTPRQWQGGFIGCDREH